MNIKESMKSILGSCASVYDEWICDEIESRNLSLYQILKSDINELTKKVELLYNNQKEIDNLKNVNSSIEDMNQGLTRLVDSYSQEIKNLLSDNVSLKRIISENDITISKLREQITTQNKYILDNLRK